METIPKIIHQLWVGHHKVPYKFIDTWRKDYIDSNPSWQYKLWREEDIDSIDMQNREIYDKEYGYSGKADIARYEILYQHGGIWIDADAVWLGGKSLNPLIEGAKKTNFFAAHEPSKSLPVMSPETANNKSAYAAWKRSLLAIGVIGSAKGHSNLKFLMKAWVHKQKVFVGMCSCVSFCDPQELIFAKKFSFPDLIDQIDTACIKKKFTIYH